MVKLYSCFPIEDIHMANKRMKKCLMSLVAMKIRIKTTSEIPLHILEMDLIMEKTSVIGV